MNILAIGSHPDDLEISCGGTLCRLSDSGHKLRLLVLSDGAAGGVPSRRAAEQKRAAAMLGGELHLCGLPDTDIRESRGLIALLDGFILKFKPNLVLTHYPRDTHQDHRAAAAAVTTAARYVPNLLYYESPTTLDFSPSVFVDIGAVLDRKLSLLRAHRSQVRRTGVPGLAILETARAMAVFRGYQDRVKYAEGFVPARLSLDCAIGPFPPGARRGPVRKLRREENDLK